MTTLSTNAISEAETSRRRRLFKLGGMASVAALALVLISVRSAHGQAPLLQIIPLAQGFSSENVVNLHVNGPSDALTADLIFQPGGETGWHYHPGPVVVVIKSGSLTETHSNGCVTVHPAGSVFFEKADDIHNAANQTGGVTEVYATFLFPAGTQPLIPAANPGNVCRP
jgi:quercetin dioxygenase-like cupin family protein